MIVVEVAKSYLAVVVVVVEEMVVVVVVAVVVFLGSGWRIGLSRGKRQSGRNQILI